MSPTDGEARPYGDSPTIMRVALVYMLTGFVTFLSMGVLGLVMRLDHAGWWVISEDWFYRIMTIHGSGMVAGLLLAGLGAMAAALSRNVALSVRWLWSAYIVYSLSMPFLLYTVLIGGFAGGWTMLDPLPYLGRTWDMWAGVMMYGSALWMALGFGIWCVHVIYVLSRKFGGVGGALAWRYFFTRGPVDPKMKVPSATELSAVAVAITGVIVVVAGAAVLIPLFAEAANIIDDVDSLYSKNFIMVFGHSVANLTIYLSVGVIYALLPLLTRRGGHTSKLIVLAWNLTIILVIVPPMHHLYQDFAQPLPLAILGQVASWSIVPEVLLITIIGSLSHIFRSGMRWTVPSILIVLGFWGWVFGGIGAVLDSSIPINNLMHNTLWVPAHFHTYYLLGVTTFLWAYLIYIIDDLSGITGWSSSNIAAWLYGIGGAGFLLMFFASGADSVPRRYSVHIADWQIYAEIAVPFVILIMISLTWLIADMLRGLGRAWANVGPRQEPRELPPWWR